MFCFMLFAVRAQKDRDDDDDSHILCTFFSWYFVSFAVYYFGRIRNGSGLVAKMMERSDGL